MLNNSILIIDDSYISINAIALCLEQLGYPIYTASNGEEGIVKANSLIPLLILLDINMPLLDGFEVCKRLKTNETTEHIPVIFLTSSNETKDIIRGFESGAVDCICKSASSEEILFRVKNHIELKQSKDKLEEYHKKFQQQREIIFLQEKELLEQRKNELLHELEVKVKEQKSTLLQLVQFGELINNLLNDLEKFETTLEHNGVLKLKKIISSYRLQMSLNNWKEFETRFLKLHDDFTKKLYNQFPYLSNNEIRMCAFLRLNMNTKDIASLTLQTEDGIKKARYRLRKKLGLSEKDSLVNFLSSI